MPTGVGVDGVGMQSFFAVHGCGDGGLLGSIKLSSKRGLDVEAAAAMLRRCVQTARLLTLFLDGPLADVFSRRSALASADGRLGVTLQLHLERFRLRFSPPLPERGDEALAMEFTPCLAQRVAQAQQQQPAPEPEAEPEQPVSIEPRHNLPSCL